ncbi:ultraviolet-B receptor UVR8 [Folsomia candida]|uniref:ultraviolet-B receptor UVR8 n=1 Tax=Folsomia candida TaxID=158441 RepID=UPI001604E356|nr:ultraviolet-B receptor UVR8 [Folsomia candida]
MPPTRIPFPPTIKPVAIAIGDGHTLTLTKDGKVFAFGRNSHGQIGNGSTKDQFQVIEVRMTITLDARRQIQIVQISCGSCHSVALSDDGSVYSWGANDKGQLGEGSKIENNPTPKRILLVAKVTKISCGKHHTLAMTERGEIYAWGSNHHGQLGTGSSSKSRIPVKIDVDGRIRDILALNSISACKFEKSGGGGDIVAMGEVGDVFSSWDTDPVTPGVLKGGEGNSAVNSNLMKWNALKCVDYEEMPALKLAFVYGSGFEQSAILISRDEDDVYFVGRSVHGSLGSGASTEFETRVPIKNVNLSGKGIFWLDYGLDVAGGCTCLFALTTSGCIYSRGYNDFGELGQGFSSLEPGVPNKIDMFGDTIKIAQIACGSDHAMAISEEGHLYAWGYNFYGQLGTGCLDDHVPTPERVTAFRSKGTEIVSVAAGMFHSVAVTGDGHVYAWGQNDKSQLGGGCSEPYSATPTLVPFRVSNSPISRVACGPDSTLALSTDGKLYFFGHCPHTPEEPSESSSDRKGHPFQLCTDLDPLDSIVDMGAKHWATMYACGTESGKIYVWGKLRGGRKKELLREEPRAVLVNDVFSFFSNPPGMIRPMALVE